MNIVRPPVLTLGPPIAKPKGRKSHTNISKFQTMSNARSSTSNISSSLTQRGHLNQSGSFDLGHFFKDHPHNNKPDDALMAQFVSKRSHIGKISMSSSERRRFSIDLSDVSKSTNIPSDKGHSGKKLRYSPSFRKTRYSMDDNNFNGSPLAFDEGSNGELPKEEDEGQLIVIKIHSNWGAPDFLRISSISILDDKYMAIPVIKSTTVPDLGLDTQCLFDGHLIKKEIKDLFSIPWDQTYQEPFRLAIVVPSDITISGVRVFNSEISKESSVKDISISLDNSNTLNGEIPKNFGVDFKFTQEMRQDAIESSRLIDDYFNENNEKSFKDQYGFYPLFLIKTISFELKKSWTNENLIGLNGIQIFDQYNKLIQIDDIDDIIVHNCGSSNNSSLLLKNDLKTSRPERQFLMKTLPDKSPLIEIIFKESRYLSRIILWNFNSSREPVEYGVKHIKICADQNIVWCGKISKSVGNEMNADKMIKTIWLTDSAEIRNEATFI